MDRPDGAAERQHLLDDVTIQETHFHRARPQIDALRDHLLPRCWRRLPARAAVSRCGARVLDRRGAVHAGHARARGPRTDGAPGGSHPAPHPVVGTDVSTAALDIARAARYGGRTIDLAEPGAVTRWVRPDGDGDHVVRDEVRGLVEFAHHNLVTEPPPFPDGTVDLVVCRNVTIYFSRETTRALVGRFRTCLGSAGWLLLGPAETLWQLSDAFSLAGCRRGLRLPARRPEGRRRPVRRGGDRSGPARSPHIHGASPREPHGRSGWPVRARPPHRLPPRSPGRAARVGPGGVRRAATPTPPPSPPGARRPTLC